jgi:hypothetical protein
MAKYEIRGNVGQHIEADSIKGGIRTRITMDAEGNMVVESQIGVEDEAE